jgi:hypothetical protein
MQKDLLMFAGVIGFIIVAVGVMVVVLMLRG